MPIPTTNTRVSQLAGELSEYRNARRNWDSFWQQIADHLIPRKGDFLVGHAPGTMNRDDKVFDSSPLQYLERFASGLSNMLCPKANPWFILEVEPRRLMERRDVQLWLEEANRALLRIFNNPYYGFHPAYHEYNLELGAFGTGSMMVQGNGRGGIMFRSMYLGECYINENALGMVDTLFRVRRLPAKVLIEQFGEDKMPGSVLKADHVQRFEVLHVVRPRPGGPKGFLKAFESVYVLLDENAVLDDGVGFDEFPGVISRWTKNPDEYYGRGPGVTALPDIKQLNTVEKSKLKVTQKMADPPMMMPDQGFLTPPRVVPGGVNYFRAGTSKDDRIGTLPVDGRPDLLDALNAQIRDRIAKAFYLDLLQLPDTTAADGDVQRFSATEIIARQRDRLPILAPIVARQETETLGPLIFRVASLAIRMGILPDPPDVLKTADFQPTYLNPISLAARATELQGLQAHMQLMTPFIQQDPSLLEQYDQERLFRLAGEIYHVPPSVFRSPAELRARQQMRMRAEAEQMQAQQGDMMAGTVEQLASADLKRAQAAETLSNIE